MRIRRLSIDGDHNRDVELAAGVLFVPLLLAAMVGLTLLPESWHPRCWLYTNLGVACPACGGFRALRLLCRGNVWSAMCLQPLLVLSALVAVAYSLFAFGVVFGRLRALRLVEVSPRDRRTVIGVGVLLILLNWLYVL